MGNTRATADTAVGGRSVRSFGYVALLIVGSAVAFATTSTTGFMGDDFESTLSVIKPGPRLDWLTSVGAGGHVRPVLWASVWANHAAFGLTPLGWHAVNMSLHAVTAWLVAVLAGALVEQGGVEADHPTTHTVRRVAPPLAGLVFLLSPVHAGPVSWIAARADLLLAPLCIVSLLGWIRSRDRRGPWLGLSYAAFALALFTKESAMTFPLVLVAYEVWFPRPFVSRYASLRRSAGRLISVGVILGAYLVHLATADAGFLEHQGRNLRSDGLDAVRSGLQTLVRSVFPSMPPTGWALVVLLTLAGLAWWTVVWHRAWKRGERLLWGETLGFLASAMVASVLPTARLGTSLTTPGGGRFAYLPSVFAAIAVALALALLMARIPRLGTAAVTTVLLGSAIALVASNQT